MKGLTLTIKPEYRLMYLRVAKAIAISSKAVRKKVGCVLVDSYGIISEGMNGMPPDWPTEVCEELVDGKLVTKPECRHAEVAALEKLWSKPNSAKGSWAFVTLSPCLPCAIKLHTAGVEAVIYEEDYRITDGLEYLRKKSVYVKKMEGGDGEIS